MFRLLCNIVKPVVSARKINEIFLVKFSKKQSVNPFKTISFKKKKELNTYFCLNYSRNLRVSLLSRY